MKLIQSSLIILCCMLFVQVVKADELKFKEGNWDQIKSLAQQENKIIFLDAYTDWCIWCKTMDKETFTDTEVIDFVNANFIPVKYEMETGLGKTLAMKYRVYGFPTQLFFLPDGKLIYVSPGYKPPQKFIELLKTVLKPENHLNLKGVSNNLDLDFPNFYKSACAKNGTDEKRFPTIDEVTAYLDVQTDLFSEVNFSVISKFQLNEKYNNYFLDNIKNYEELFGNYSINRKLYSIIYTYLQPAIDENSEQKLNEILTMIDKYDSENAENNKDFYRFQFYKETKNWNKYIEFIDTRIETGKFDDEQINDYSWTIYENCNDEKSLSKAVKWIKPVVERKPNYMNLDTYAALLYKTNDFPNAKKYAEQAIKIGLESSMKVSDTEVLLEKINAKLNK